MSTLHKIVAYPTQERSKWRI